MRIGPPSLPPTMPHHVMKAYGVTAPGRPAAVRGADSAARVGGEAPGGRGSRLVAGVVRGGIDFSGAEPQPSGASLRFYRHPASANAAATALEAGRVLDLEA